MVGSFPDATRRRLAAVVAVLVLVVVALASPLAFADDLKDKQKEVKKQLSGAKAELTESSAAASQAHAALQQARVALSAAQARLAETRGKLVAAQIRDRQMQAALDAAVKALAASRAELRRGQAEVERQRVAVGEMVANMYELGDPDMMAMSSLMHANGLEDLTRTSAANESISDAENAILDRFKAAEVLLAVKEAKVEERKGEVEIQRQAAADNLKLMEALEAQAEAEERGVQAMVAQRAAMVAAAEKAMAKDRAVLASVRAEEARITELLRQRALAAAKSGGSANGFLSYPVKGRITSPYGYRIHPIYGYYGLHNGTDFGADCGAPLYATADGTVLSAGYSDVYGNYLILDHGGRAGVNLASRYNHATHYTVGTGSRVRRGEVIGYVGSTGWSTGCHLHFSVLANGAYVDPMNWF